MQIGDAVLVAAAGFLGGGVNAVAGGGSLIVFPALIATGLGTLPANVTNSVALWPGYLGGLFGFRAELAGQRDRATPLIGAAAVGSALGCALLLATPEGAFEVVVPFLVLLASLLLAVQPRIGRLVGPPRTDSMRLLVPVVGVASVYGGYFGGALGVILLGTLALTVSDTLRRLNGLKSALQLVVATVTVIAFALFGPVDWALAAVVAPASLLGGFAGARVARRLDDRVLRVAVVVFGVVVSAVLFTRI